LKLIYFENGSIDFSNRGHFKSLLRFKNQIKIETINLQQKRVTVLTDRYEFSADVKNDFYSNFFDPFWSWKIFGNKCCLTDSPVSVSFLNLVNF
jgi:hypothetical protein